MDYLPTVLERLAVNGRCGYHVGAPAATEPMALAAIALFAHARDEPAWRHASRLVELQNADGSIGITPAQDTPGWATGWAVSAWCAARKNPAFESRYSEAIDRALPWILATRGAVVELSNHFGHDGTIEGWPWVDGTHAWLEPTAINLLALRHARHGSHPRAREATRLLIDRLLDDGGCNYGNTTVLGQDLRPHLQPTGLCLLALAGERHADQRIARSIAYLTHNLSRETPTASLCYGLLGLAAWDACPSAAADWLQAAAHRTLGQDAGCYKLALLALAALGPECPLIPGAEPQ